MSLFFYGTLMSSAVLLRVLLPGEARPDRLESKGRTLKLQHAVLEGARRHTVKEEVYPALILTVNASDKVAGMLCEGLSPSDIDLLDRFEGSEYERRSVKILAQDGQVPSTQVYVWIAPREHLDSQEWDFEHFKTAKQAAWLAYSDEFTPL
ncbi:hypothetical protein BZG36_03763 [Bifiguratus adelaidae]|uniref:Putative gamma-glutamylcyclotransferase n=1 Tax=Bifiguratus adelaidae TaxID=1938954 RepID=A0A261Y074_9FUNG|nr:hypothetical protein BZG36_03763 [Bifiguratus adelaidae]